MIAVYLFSSATLIWIVRSTRSRTNSTQHAHKIFSLGLPLIYFNNSSKLFYYLHIHFFFYFFLYNRAPFTLTITLNFFFNYILISLFILFIALYHNILCLLFFILHFLAWYQCWKILSVYYIYHAIYILYITKMWCLTTLIDALISIQITSSFVIENLN